MNKEKRTVEIEWDENRLHEDDQKKTAVVDSKVQSEETTEGCVASRDRKK